VNIDDGEITAIAVERPQRPPNKQFRKNVTTVRLQFSLSSTDGSSGDHAHNPLGAHRTTLSNGWALISE
jgi:hypothetical protein